MSLSIPETVYVLMSLNTMGKVLKKWVSCPAKRFVISQENEFWGNSPSSREQKYEGDFLLMSLCYKSVSSDTFSRPSTFKLDLCVWYLSVRKTLSHLKMVTKNQKLNSRVFKIITKHTAVLHCPLLAASTNYIELEQNRHYRINGMQSLFPCYVPFSNLQNTIFFLAWAVCPSFPIPGKYTDPITELELALRPRNEGQTRLDSWSLLP